MAAVNITVPPGAMPGDPMTVERDGKTVEVVIPPGASPGEVLTIEFVHDDEDGVESSRESVVTLSITVPPGLTPGEIVMLEHEGKAVEFTVPLGAKEGDEIEVRPEELIGGSSLDDGSDQVVEEFTGSRLVITVPPGAKPGEIVVLELEGKAVEFTVPLGAKEGDEIDVRPEQLIGGSSLDDGSDQVVEGFTGSRLVINVPPGAKPGEIVMLELEGKAVEFTVPLGAKEGDEIDVRPEQLLGGSSLDYGSDQVVEGFTGSRLVITVPPGAKPGEIVMLELEGKAVEFTVPLGAKEGDEIDVRPEELLGGSSLDDEGRGQVAEEPSGSRDDDGVVIVGDGGDSVDELHADLGIATRPGISCDDPIPQPVFISLVVPENVSTLTFEAPDGRTFSLPIPEGSSAGDVMTVQLPDMASSDDDQAKGTEPDSSQMVEEKEDGTTIRTTVEERENGSIVRTIETTTTLPGGHKQVVTEEIIEETIEKPVFSREKRAKLRAQMLEFRRKAEEESKRNQSEVAAAPRRPKQKPTIESPRTKQLMLGDADDFFAAGELRAGGRYAYNQGLYTGGGENDVEANEANPYMPNVGPTEASEWYKPAPPPKEAGPDVEESRKGAMARSEAITDFEEARAAIFDEEGNERPTPQLIIALEAASIVHLRKAEGLNENLDALIAKDEKKSSQPLCQTATISNTFHNLYIKQKNSLRFGAGVSIEQEAADTQAEQSRSQVKQI